MPKLRLVGLGRRIARATHLRLTSDLMNTTAWTLMVLAVFLLSVGLSTNFAREKQLALAMHTRDYAFYLEFYSKLFDTKLSNQYSINPNGRNLLYLRGTEGVSGLHKTVHFEPVKYGLALLYRLKPSPTTMFATFAFLYLLPILYIFHTMKERTGNRLALLFAVAFGTSYVTVIAIAFDLRPYSLLGPAFIVNVLALHLRRPSWEVYTAFIALFLIREEAIILGGVVFAYALVASRGPQGDYYRRVLKGLLSLYVIGVLCVVTFMLAAGFSNQLSLSKIISRPMFGVAAGSLVVIAIGAVTLAIKCGWERTRYAPIGVLVFTAVPLWWEIYGMNPVRVLDLEKISSVLFSGRASLLFAVVFVILLVVWSISQSRMMRRLIVSTMPVLILLSIVYHSTESLSSFRWYRAQQSDARLIWDLKHAQEFDMAKVLVDLQTHQAFFDWESVWAYQRLPTYLVGSTALSERYWPQNKQLLQGLVRNDVDLIIVSTMNLSMVLDGVVPHDMVESIEQVAANDSYVALRIPRESDDTQDSKP